MRRLLALVVVVLACVWTPARAQEAAEKARSLARSAKQLALDGNLAEALALYEQAYTLDPATPLLYTIGRVSDKAGKLVRARAALEQYLREEKDPEGLARGRNALEAVMARWSGWVRVVSPSQGAVVELDGKPVGRIPLERPLEVSPGRHSIRVYAPGKLPFEENLQVKAAEGVEVHAALQDEPSVLSLAVEPARAAVTLDGKPLAWEPVPERKDAWRLAPLHLGPGKHWVAVSAEGHEPQQGEIELAVAEKKSVSFTLMRKPAPAPPAVAPAVVKPAPAAPAPQANAAPNDLSGRTAVKQGSAPPEKDNTLTWVLVGVGTAALVGGGVAAYFMLRGDGGSGNPTWVVK
jgi:hypothetical protein